MVDSAVGVRMKTGILGVIEKRFGKKLYVNEVHLPFGPLLHAVLPLLVVVGYTAPATCRAPPWPPQVSDSQPLSLAAITVVSLVFLSPALLSVASPMLPYLKDEDIAQWYSEGRQ